MASELSQCQETYIIKNSMFVLIEQFKYSESHKRQNENSASD
jgi:hypothetical protein